MIRGPTPVPIGIAYAILIVAAIVRGRSRSRECVRNLLARLFANIDGFRRIVGIAVGAPARAKVARISRAAHSTVVEVGAIRAIVVLSRVPCRGYIISCVVFHQRWIDGTELRPRAFDILSLLVGDLQGGCETVAWIAHRPSTFCGGESDVDCGQ